MLNDVKMRTTTAQLSIWTKKFAASLMRLQGTKIQKISASDKGELILSVFKPNDDKSLVILSMMQGSSGIFCTKEKPPTLEKPNSFVQMARKHIMGKRVLSCYLTVSPICVVIELNDRQEQEPNCLILDLDHKPPRVVLSRKTIGIPERYQKEFAGVFSQQEDFFESFCEWSMQNTKTKRRACFEHPVVGYCALASQRELSEQKSDQNLDSQNQSQKKIKSQSPIPQTQDPLSLFSTEERRAIRTRLQFLERRLKRQRQDLPSEAQILLLQKQGEELKTSQVKLPAGVLDKLYRQIDKLKRRKEELELRVAQGQGILKEYKDLIFSLEQDASLQDDKSSLLAKICRALGMPLADLKKTKQKTSKQEKRSPFYSFVTSNGEFIRVARSGEEGDEMIKQMPSNHLWLHVLIGEGSHVWLEKPRGLKKVSPQSIREAAILAVHYSKNSKSQSGEVQIATRADIEKKKNLPPGKVLVRRCETLLIRYDRSELQKIRNFE